MLNCAEEVQIQTYKTHAIFIRHPKQHVPKQSCANIQLSSKEEHSPSEKTHLRACKRFLIVVPCEPNKTVYCNLRRFPLYNLFLFQKYYIRTDYTKYDIKKSWFFEYEEDFSMLNNKNASEQ